MKISVRIINRKNFSFLLLGIGFVGSLATNANAQVRDPFTKPVVRRVGTTIKVGLPPKPTKPTGPTVVGAPPIQSRIDGYRAVRQRCAELGVACPKPTSVLTLDEMQVTGIFRTPRGYAAMVEASPLNPKLSYTIYPGEKFYDGQLIAIEDTRLIFRRVTRMSDGKEIVASSDKILRQENINDLTASRPDSQMQNNTPKPAPTVSSATGETTSPQMSAEAVPLPGQKEAPVPVTETKVNQRGLQQNRAERSNKPATKKAVPAASDPVSPVEADPKADAAPAPSKTKAKTKAKTKKSS